MAITRISKNNYKVDVSIGYDLVNGKRKRVIRKGIKSLESARALEKEILNLDDRGIDVTSNPLTKEVIKEYLHQSKMYDRPSTYTKKCNVFKNHISYYFENYKIREITKHEVIRFKEYLVELNISNNYKRYILTALKTFFNYCMKNELVFKNPTITIDNFKKEKVVMKFWTLKEFKTFIKCVDDELYYNLFSLLYYTGMRKGEALALQWKDVDVESNAINIYNTCSYLVGKGYTITSPKTESSKRTIYINETLTNDLKALKSNKNYYNLKNEDFIFAVPGNVIPKTSITRMFSHYIKESGVKKIRLHDLRHSHVALLINLKEDILKRDWVILMQVLH